MKNQWSSEPGGRQLAGYVGAFGVPTAGIVTAADLIAVAGRLFGIAREPDCRSMASTISALGKKERAKRAHRNAGRAAPPPNPASAAQSPPDGLAKMMSESTPQLIDGRPFGVEGQLDIDPAKLLRKVVSAVISAGHAADLCEFPDVLAFFNARMPAPAKIADHPDQPRPD